MLVGRDTELATLQALLAENRVVTLTGVGGVGKTALAWVAAAGATVCELAPVVRPGDVPAAVADALGFSSMDGAVVGMTDSARLVVLDNCEHVLDAAAATVERLITQCPAVRVLVTSREALDVPGERVLPLEPLALPDGGESARLATSPAAALLLARARDAGAEIVLDDEGVRAVAALCRRLDGLPLAIELAAARTRTLTPSEILAHVDDRLDLLVKPRLRGPPRHRSLDAAVAWSHERLPDATRRFFDLRPEGLAISVVGPPERRSSRAGSGPHAAFKDGAGHLQLVAIATKTMLETLLPDEASKPALVDESRRPGDPMPSGVLHPNTRRGRYSRGRTAGLSAVSGDREAGRSECRRATWRRARPTGASPRSG